MTFESNTVLTKRNLKSITRLDGPLDNPNWITKSIGRKTIYPHDVTWYRSGPYADATSRERPYSVVSGGETIRYLQGPQYSGGHVSWKPCYHEKTNEYSGSVGELSVDVDYSRDYNLRAHGHIGLNLSRYMPSMPQEVWPAQDLWDQVWDKIDLNTSDAVMAYSNVVQAVPLLGQLAKANQVLGRILSWAKTSLRKKPFSEVIRTAIQLDFVDRFVISPTLDDLRKVQDSMDYVLRIIEKAHHRNSVITPLRSRIVETLSNRTDSTAVRVSDAWNGRIVGVDIPITIQAKSTRTSGLFLLADLKYDAGAINPLKVWLNRVGLSRPLESAWDLVPFSFVVDYFARVGEFITHISDQMAHDNALVGRIARLYDVWATSRVSASVTAKGGAGRWFGWSDNVYHDRRFAPSVQTYQNTVFSRRQIPLEALDQSGFWKGRGLISPNLSVIRARTIAELLIQAKL